MFLSGKDGLWERMMEMPKDALDVSDDDTWKPCLFCGGGITQVRKALFTCENCNKEYIADEEDMRP